jgi:hypothetical protein
MEDNVETVSRSILSNIVLGTYALCVIPLMIAKTKAVTDTNSQNENQAIDEPFLVQNFVQNIFNNTCIDPQRHSYKYL